MASRINQFEQSRSSGRYILLIRLHHLINHCRCITRLFTMCLTPCWWLIISPSWSLVTRNASTFVWHGHPPALNTSSYGFFFLLHVNLLQSQYLHCSSVLDSGSPLRRMHGSSQDQAAEIYRQSSCSELLLTCSMLFAGSVHASLPNEHTFFTSLSLHYHCKTKRKTFWQHGFLIRCLVLKVSMVNIRRLYYCIHVNCFGI
jgi:hypothetical protein